MKRVAFADQDPEAEKLVVFNIHCQAMGEDHDVTIKINDTVKFSNKTIREGSKTILPVSMSLDALSLNNSLSIIDRTPKEDPDSVLLIYSVEMEIETAPGD